MYSKFLCNKMRIKANYYYCCLFGLAVLLFCLLYKNISNICTVWELGDEAGYLYNAVYFLNRSWKCVGAYNPFYGYGYSLFLFPCYLLSNDGVSFIQGAILVNVFFVVGSYFIISYLLNRLVFHSNSYSSIVISAIICVSPYMIANTYKVFSEECIVFFSCLGIFLFYKFFTTSKKTYLVLFSCVLAFGYAIHTRMLLLVPIYGFVFMVALIRFRVNPKEYKKYIHDVLCSVFFFCLSLGIVYLIKKSILDYRSSISVSVTNQTNVITTNFVTDRIKWLLNPSNTIIYGLSFLSKLFYIIVETYGLCFIGGYHFVKSMKNNAKNNEFSLYVIKLFVFLSPILMALCFTLSGAGMPNQYVTYFYSRYYNNLLIIFFAFVFSYALLNKTPFRIMLSSVFLFILCGSMTYCLKNYLSTDEIYIDTNRAPSFTAIVLNSSNFSELIIRLSITALIVMIVFSIINNEFKLLKLAVIFVMVYACSLNVINQINTVNNKAKADSEIASYILEDDVADVLFVNDDSYKYKNYFIRMQVLLKDVELQVEDYNLEENNTESFYRYYVGELSDEEYILVYKSSPLNYNLSQLGFDVMEGSIFNLYYNS